MSFRSRRHRQCGDRGCGVDVSKHGRADGYRHCIPDGSCAPGRHLAGRAFGGASQRGADSATLSDAHRARVHIVRMRLMPRYHEIEFEWVHLSHQEPSVFVETYGFSGNQGAINLEGIRIRPVGKPSDTLLVFMHPASTLQLLSVPRAAAQLGAHVLCAGSRYQRNDTAAILEKVLLDLGAYIRHSREVWSYAHIVLVGWSGGGSLALFYQSQAERPTITHTPAGDPADMAAAGLMQADAIIFQA